MRGARMKIIAVGGVALGSLCATGLAQGAPTLERTDAAERVLADFASVGTAPKSPQRTDAPPTRALVRGPLAATASGSFSDAWYDNEDLAPDLRVMTAFTEDDGTYNVGIRLNSNALVDGDLVATYVNTDGNQATGSPTFGGADIVVGIVGQIGPDFVQALRWNGSTFEATTIDSLVSYAVDTTDELWWASAAELGIAPGTRTTLVFATLYSGLYSDYFDFAPEPGVPPFVFTAGALGSGPSPAPPTPPPGPAPPPPAAPPPPPAPSTPPAPGAGAAQPGPSAGGGAPTGSVAGTTPDRPLVVRSFDVRSVPGAVRVRLGWVRGSGRVEWRLQLTAKVNGRTRTRLARGVGSAGTRSVNRLVRLPSGWRGKQIVARLTVSNDSRTVSRRSTVHFR